MVFPNIVTPLVVARDKSVNLINQVISGNRMLGLVAQRQAEVEDPNAEDLYPVGVAAVILRMLKFPDGSLRVLVQGLSRVRLSKVIQTEPFFVAQIDLLHEELKQRLKSKL